MDLRGPRTDLKGLQETREGLRGGQDGLRRHPEVPQSELGTAGGSVKEIKMERLPIHCSHCPKVRG